MVTDGRFAYALPHGDDRSGAFRTRDEGQLGTVAANALALVDVHEVDAGRRDLDRYLPRSGLRRLTFHHAQHIWAAQLPAHYHTHATLLFCPHQISFPRSGAGPHDSGFF